MESFRQPLSLGSIGINAEMDISKQRQKSYHDELERQVLEKKRQKEEEKVRSMRLEQKLEEDQANYNPWGRGGAGAPRLDADGNRITSRNVMSANRYQDAASMSTIRETVMSCGDHSTKDVDDVISLPDTIKDLETVSNSEVTESVKNSENAINKSGDNGDTLSTVSDTIREQLHTPLMDKSIGFQQRSLESPFNLPDEPKRSGRRLVGNIASQNTPSKSPFGVDNYNVDFPGSQDEAPRRTGRRQFVQR